MACVTLKRSLDFDPLHSPQRATKRRRCVPLHGQHTPEKGEGVVGPSVAPSPFLETPLTPEQIANNLRDEIKRLKKRRQFCGAGSSSPGAGAGGPPSPSSPPASPGSAPASPEPMMDTENQATGSRPGSDKPIFSLRQMSLIAERMCSERVEQVRAEYDQILHQKLSEQYDAFVKFIDHQIQKRFNESQAPSYLS